MGQLWVQSKGKGAAGLEVHLGGEGISLARLARDLHAHSTPHSRPRGDRRIRRGEETNSSEHGTGDNRVQKALALISGVSTEILNTRVKVSWPH